MAVLSKEQIIEYMDKPELEDRLVITPLFPHKKKLVFIGPASIDVRLGTEFIILRKQTFPLLNISKIKDLRSKIEKYQERTRLRFREEFVLHPGQLIIGSTLEYISLPKDLMCYVVGKSSWGRMGLIIATATKVDPGYRGCITLEIINEGEVPLIVFPGVPMAQLVFHKTAPTEKYKGKYHCPTGPQFPDFSSDEQYLKFWYPKRIIDYRK